MIKKILLPVDGSDLAHKAAIDGIGLAQALGATAIGLFVTEPYQYIFVYPGDIPLTYPGKTEYEKMVNREAQKHLGALAQAAGAAGAWHGSRSSSRSVRRRRPSSRRQSGTSAG